MRKVKVKIPASTTNLGCGFDCLGLALTCYNVVEMELIEEKGVFIRVEGEGENFIPKDTKNIIFPALEEIFKKIGKKPSGIKITEINHIPIGKGLGSSAATRLGGIVAASHLLDVNLSYKEILKIATKLEGHPDNVAASLLGGFVAVVNNGKDLLWIKLDIPENLKVVVVVPELQILTEKARKILPLKVSLSDAVFNLSRVALLVPSLTQGVWNNLQVAMQDKLHQPYRASLLPGMEDVFKAAFLAGAKGAFLSGAGSSIAAFTLEKEEDVGKAMKEAFSKNGIRSKVMILSVDREGVRVDEKKQ